MTTRRRFLSMSATAIGGVTLASSITAAGRAAASEVTGTPRLPAPKTGKIKVAVALNEGATVIDFAGPWEVFQDVHVMDRGDSMDEMMPFELYTVAPTTASIRATAGLHIIPDYSVETAPAPDLVVVPAMRGHPALLEWLNHVSADNHLTMSVCTGAFQLARAGLLDGLTATTHHDFYDRFESNFPDVELKRGLRFVEHDRIATAGGLTSGIDLALRVVERYFGREVAQWTADYMEYTSEGWKV